MDRTQTIHLFTDGSVNTITKTGFGAILFVDDPNISIEIAKELVETIRFDNTSSTKLEIQTILQAFDKIPKNTINLTIYTDSQNILRLPERKNKLDKNHYKTRTGKDINNHKLYQEFYTRINQFNFNIVKIKGHQKAILKDKYDQLFTLVDRASRKTLRGYSLMNAE